MTSASSLLGCRRRVEFTRGQSASKGNAPLNVPAALGDLCHEVLQRATESREILDGDWEQALELSWGGYLLPFRQRTIELALDPGACEALATSVASAITDFNQRAPSRQPASPAPDNCRWCAGAAECEEVWEVGDESWAPMASLAEGVVAQAVRSEIGLLTIVLDLTAGTLGEGRIAIKADSAGLERPELGASLRVTGLTRKGERTYALTPWSELRVSPS